MIAGTAGHARAARFCWALGAVVVLCVLISPVAVASERGHPTALTMLVATTSGTDRQLAVTGRLGARAPSGAAAGRGWRVELQRRGGGRWSTVAARSLKVPYRSFSLMWTVPGRAPSVRVRVRVRSGHRVLVTGNAQLVRPKTTRATALSPMPALPKAPTPAAPGAGMSTRTNVAPAIFVPEPASVSAAPAAGQAGSLVLTGTPVLSAGSYIAVDVGPNTPAGFFAQVLSSEVQGDQTVVQTQPAALIDAVPDGSISITGNELTPDPRLRGQNRSDLLECEGGAGPSIDVTSTFDFHADADFAWSGRQVSRARMSLRTDLAWIHRSGRSVPSGRRQRMTS
jgi:hypothetical protein